MNLARPFESFEEDAEVFAARFDQHVRDLQFLISTYAPRHAAADLRRQAEDHAFAAVHSINRLRDVADEVHSLSRGLRVPQEGAAA